MGIGSCTSCQSGSVNVITSERQRLDQNRDITLRASREQKWLHEQNAFQADPTKTLDIQV